LILFARATAEAAFRRIRSRTRQPICAPAKPKTGLKLCTGFVQKSCLPPQISRWNQTGRSAAAFASLLTKRHILWVFWLEPRTGLGTCNLPLGGGCSTVSHGNTQKNPLSPTCALNKSGACRNVCPRSFSESSYGAAHDHRPWTCSDVSGGIGRVRRLTVEPCSCVTVADVSG